MIRIADKTELKTGILFFTKKTDVELYNGKGGIFQGEYLQAFPCMHLEGRQECCVGIRETGLTKRMLMEVAACGVAFWRENKVEEIYVDLTGLADELTEENFPYFVQGLCLGNYEPPAFRKKNKKSVDITLIGTQMPETLLIQGIHMAEGVAFARDMGNYPGNLLRPKEFATAIRNQIKNLEIEIEFLEEPQLEALKMGGLLTVGSSSAFPPCMVILRYTGEPAQHKKGRLGLIGKGVTCDTGGYCMKSSDSMVGIRGDMAGGAAVVGCIYALAKNQVPVNVTGIIPICENRISPDSYLPGDVITMYDKTRVEICNTDAEGRLILADAVAYAIKNEGVQQVVDIATLTGAVVNMFGFSIGGILCDNEQLYHIFQRAAKQSGEQYARIPYYKEHEDMLSSNVADLKNLGPDYCGTITAGLFIRRFMKGRPWLHMDIAGTAWIDVPLWKFQSRGATGAGVSTLYELCKIKAIKSKKNSQSV